jgi:aspartate kinase
VSADGETTDLTFTVGRSDLARTTGMLEDMREQLGCKRIDADGEVVKVSVIGVGMRSHAGTAHTMFRTLAERGINIQAISTSEIKISILIDEAYTELALRALHTAYGLDAA